MSQNMFKMIEVDEDIWVRASSIKKVEVCNEEIIITFNGGSCHNEPMSIKCEDNRNAARTARGIIDELNEEKR